MQHGAVSSVAERSQQPAFVITWVVKQSQCLIRVASEHHVIEHLFIAGRVGITQPNRTVAVPTVLPVRVAFR